MSTLSVSFDGVSVTPMRPLASKNYGSADVPSGTCSVIALAARIFRSMGKTVAAPELNATGLDALISGFKSGLSAVDTYSNPNETSLYPTDRTQVLNPTAAEKTAKIDVVRGFTDAEAANYAEREGVTLAQAKDILRRQNKRIDEDGVTLPDPTVSEAAILLVDERKTGVVDTMLSVVSMEDLRVALNPTVIKSSSTGTIDATGLILTDANGGFIAAGVAAGDIVKVDGHLCKVDSRDSATQLTLETPAKELVSATPYKIWRDAFIGQFTFSTQE